MSLPPIQAAALPPPIRLETETAWPVPVRGDLQRSDAEAARRPAPPANAAQAEQDRRDRGEQEMLGRLRVALAEPQAQPPGNVMRRGSYGVFTRTPADLLDQRISGLLGDGGPGSLRRLDERA